MGRNRPPFDSPPPGVPMGAIMGGPPPRRPPSAQLEAKIVPRADVQKALYNASAVLAASNAQLLQALALLSETHLACKQTVQNAREMDGPVMVGGVHISAAQFAERFEIARQEDADAVAKAIAIIQTAVEHIGDERLIELADRGAGK